MSIDGGVNTLSFHPTLLRQQSFDTFTAYLRNAAYAYVGNPGVNKIGPSANYQTNQPSKDINEFPIILDEVLKYEQDMANVPDEERVELVEEHVDLHVERETISWNLVRRNPGTFSQGKPGNANVQEYSYHLRNTDTDTNNPGQNILNYGRYMDNLVQLTCWAIKGRTANERALWLESLMDKFQWYFMFRGISRVVYKERTRDMFVNHNNVRLEGRPLIYYVRTEQILPIHTSTLKQVFFNIRGTEPLELRN